MEAEETLNGAGFVKISEPEMEICTKCLICGCAVPLKGLDREHLEQGHSVYKVCRECKDAVAMMKRSMKNRG